MKDALIIIVVWFGAGFLSAGFIGRAIKYGMTGELTKRDEFEYEPPASQAWGK